MPNMTVSRTLHSVSLTGVVKRTWNSEPVLRWVPALTACRQHFWAFSLVGLGIRPNFFFIPVFSWQCFSRVSWLQITQTHPDFVFFILIDLSRKDVIGSYMGYHWMDGMKTRLGNWTLSNIRHPYVTHRSRVMSSAVDVTGHFLALTLLPVVSLLSLHRSPCVHSPGCGHPVGWDQLLAVEKRNIWTIQPGE